MQFRCVIAEEMRFQYRASVEFSNQFHLVTLGMEKLLSQTSLGLLIISHDWK